MNDPKKDVMAGMIRGPRIWQCRGCHEIIAISARDLRPASVASIRKLADLVGVPLAMNTADFLTNGIEYVCTPENQG
jgi:hypothetical protein